MLKNYFTLISFIILSGKIINVAAQTKSLNIVTTAVPFLRISPDARAGGMGDVGVAISADANASFWNTAKLPFADKKAGIGVSYIPWLRGSNIKDIYLTSLAGYYQLDNTQAISGSLKYFSLGNIQFTDEMGNDLSSYRPKEFAIDAGYSRKLSEKLGLGIALRYIHSSLANGSYNGQTYKAGSAVAGDISLFHDGTTGMSRSGLNWGISITNLGSKISYTSDADQKNFLPTNLGLGVAYTNIIDEETSITFGIEANKLLVTKPPQLSGSSTSSDSVAIATYRRKGVLSSVFNSFNNISGQIAVGAEFTYQVLSIRGGYSYEPPSEGNRRSFTLGAGVKFSVFGLNFSYLIPTGSTIANSPLQNTLRTSLLFDLNKK